MSFRRLIFVFVFYAFLSPLFSVWGISLKTISPNNERAQENNSEAASATVASEMHNYLCCMLEMILMNYIKNGHV